MAASSENQQQIQLSEETQIIHKAAPSTPPELATMTNVVNVLDLHKNEFPNETKIYDKNTNTVYVYSNAPAPSSKIDETTGISVSSPESAVMHHVNQQHALASESQQMHHVVINQNPSELSIDNSLKDEHFELMQESNGVMMQRIVNDHLTEGRLIHHAISDVRSNGNVSNEQQILAKINASDDSLFRFIESNQLVSKLVGENQQIVSRDIINGEHHIITRNENGEHILTRIVNTAVDTLANNAGIGISKLSDDIKGTTQIIYTHDNSVIKNSQPYESMNSSDPQKQIDLIYEDGNKTVIYASSAAHHAESSNPDSPSESKNLEMFSAGGECLNGAQVIVQGNLQYTPQIQPDGTTVYVVSELVNNDINGQR